MVQRVFLAVVGVLYAGLAAWCAVGAGDDLETVGLRAAMAARGGASF